jgi:hypothetical protein
MAITGMFAGKVSQRTLTNARRRADEKANCPSHSQLAALSSRLHTITASTSTP